MCLGCEARHTRYSLVKEANQLRLDGLTPNTKTPNSAKRKADFASPSISKIGKSEVTPVKGKTADGLQYVPRYRLLCWWVVD